MLRSVSVTAILLASATPALDQRADENVVRAAGDAFGNSVGNERIGLYMSAMYGALAPSRPGTFASRDFPSPHGGFTTCVVSGSTIRVGLTAQSYLPGTDGHR